jgi:hypothetical protein
MPTYISVEPESTPIQATQWFVHGDHPAVTKLPPERAETLEDTYGWIEVQGEGQVVSPGDWIVESGVGGWYQPVDPETFAESYEPVEDTDAPM